MFSDAYSGNDFKRIRDGLYKSSHRFLRPWIKSLSNMPAIVPCVMPWPESPVAM